MSRSFLKKNLNSGLETEHGDAYSKGAIAMVGLKVEKKNAQVNLVFAEVVERGSKPDRLVEDLGLGFHGFA